MRPLRVTSIGLAVLALCAACGDDVAATTGGSTSTSTSTSADTSTTATTGVPTTTGDGTTSTDTPTTSASASGSTGPGTGESTGSSSTTDVSTTEVGTSTSTSTTDADTSTSTTDGSTTDASTSTSTGDTSTTSGTSTGESDTGDESSTGEDTDTGGEMEGFGYVGMSGNSRLVRFDTGTGLALLPSTSLLPHGNYPYDMKITPDGSELWVVGATGDGVKVVDTLTGEITQEIDLTGVGEYPVDVLFNAAGTLAYVSARDSKAVVVIDAATYAVQTTIPLGIYDGGKMALDPCSGRIYMVDWYDKSLLVVEPAIKKVTPIILGTSLWDLAFDPASKLLYVTDRAQSKVHIFDTDNMQLQTSVVVGKDPWGIDITSDGGLLVVASEDDHIIQFIDTDTLIPSTINLPVDTDMRDVAIHADDQRAFVPTGDVLGEDIVYEVDLELQSVTTQILLGATNLNANVVAVRPQLVVCQ